MSILLRCPPRKNSVQRIKACPVCKTIRPGVETVCECGHDFVQQAAKDAEIVQPPSFLVAPEPSIIRRIVPAIKFISALTALVGALAGIAFLVWRAFQEFLRIIMPP